MRPLPALALAIWAGLVGSPAAAEPSPAVQSPAPSAAPAAAPPPGVPSGSPASAASAPPRAGAGQAASEPARGFAVLAAGDSSAAAWPLAREVYARASLRPSFGEAYARVLAGESPGPDAPKDLVDLAETRAAIRGDDAPSRRLLGSLATTLHLRGIVVVMAGAGTSLPVARTFVAEVGSFDAARLAPEGSSASPEWAAAAALLDRAYGERAASAPLLASQPTPHDREKERAPRPFYSSPWFWAAVGAAALGGAALYFATRDNDPGTIHLQLQVPR